VSEKAQEALSPELARALERIAFRDARAAALNLARLGKHLSPGLAAMLPTLLEESPDPDGALNLLERLAEAAGAELFRSFERQSFLLHYALVVFGASPWLGETLIQNPDLFHALGREKSLERTHSREEFRESLARFRSRSFESDAALLLARFKRREYIRILLRDLLGIATLAETTSEISALSDVLIEEALREADAALRNRYGAPQHTDAHGRLLETPFAVLALGKLGGNELNYSSDVDLLYLYGDGERPGTPAISNREYFIRLAQQVTEILSRPTREGSVFRIDLRLRPQGREGEPAVALAHALRYYGEVAHDWEMQALIKARYSAGDLGLAREFLRGVQPYVYKAQVNFPAIETALDSREKIGSRRRLLAARTGTAALDVKLDRGGIRDVEFLVQCLQRVYGGAEPWLRSGGTLFSLQKLHDKQHLSGKDFHELNSGYELLRRVEHRLQVRRGQQTHRLPEAEAELRALARSVGTEAPGGRRADDLPGLLRQRMAGLAEIYHHIIHSERQVGEAAEGEFRLRAGPESGREPSYNDILGRLAADAPALYGLASRRELGTHARRNLHRFLSAAFTSSERYAAVARAPEAVERALRLFGVSDFLTDILLRHPEEIATVAEVQAEQAGTGALFAGELPAGAASDPVFEFLASAPGTYGEKLALLRQHYRHRVFAAGARDVMEPRPVYESLAEMTAAADDAIRAALALAEAEGFAVLALGRLGSEEFDIASDADLLFVRDERADAAQAARAAERVVEALAAYTKEGIVFAVDPRLRPRGGEGELVVTPSNLEHYFAQEAHPWEALTYTKLRRIAGSEEVAERAVTRVERHFTRFSLDHGFVTAAREMRAKLEKAEAGERNFKTVAGGFYDIDFIACTLLVRAGVGETRGSIRERLHGLAARGLLSDADCATLDAAAELLRTVEHVVRLVLGRARKSLPAAEHARRTVEQQVARILGREFPEGLEREMERGFERVRAVYEKVLQ
jgi:glutamate-ammonia-ligase adenylyltransferase